MVLKIDENSLVITDKNTLFKKKVSANEVEIGEGNQIIPREKFLEFTAAGDGGAGTDINVNNSPVTLTGSSISIRLEDGEAVHMTASILVEDLGNSDIVDFSIMRDATEILSTSDFNLSGLTIPLNLSGSDAPGAGDYVYSLQGYDDGTNPATRWFINSFKIIKI